MPPKYTPEKFITAFWAKVDKTGDCWLWTASTGSNGYGQVRKDNRPAPAHRVAYELTIGPIPEGLDLDHLCRVPTCVNPKHLEPVTARTNILRGTGPTAKNALKTHCLKGHPFDTANTYLRNGRHGIQRECRKCAALAMARKYIPRITVVHPDWPVMYPEPLQ